MLKNARAFKEVKIGKQNNQSAYDLFMERYYNACLERGSSNDMVGVRMRPEYKRRLIAELKPLVALYEDEPQRPVDRIMGLPIYLDDSIPDVSFDFAKYPAPPESEEEMSEELKLQKQRGER